MDICYAIVPLMVLLAFCDQAASLECYQCNSAVDSECQEFFNHDLPDSSQRPKLCTMYQAQYCIKVTGMWGGVVGTHRFCSSRDLGNQCQDMRFPDHSRKYRGCVYTCSADGCNGSSTVSASIISISTGLMATVLFLVMRR
ncbi:U-scoloptoxin(05)-Sm1a-like [Dreissena polymorpha]|uniref:Protein sleepless n=1 Tax=Dreissena polymorpha TaxID=45954 RepID=A0A9D4HVP9_DREPO|nr:U-scoloptoxin(05)-Sm1a-like [Dreissena polymorpha]XP_052240740.1 U-scoloptoxin(05)-Sm1a-like [Dreissena polymorpha]KAH3734677.1 hypothetical protein DPMN_041117 [Dreissena polymorpha]KAH3734829.1 hypothetical protein DPMN_041279 [Dreissena polymorpha]